MSLERCWWSAQRAWEYFSSASWLDKSRVHLYAVYDYWHTSPNFFLARVGILLVIVLAAYVWCHWGADRWASAR